MSKIDLCGTIGHFFGLWGYSKACHRCGAPNPDFIKPPKPGEDS